MGGRLKKYYLYSFFFAIIVAMATYFFLSLKPAIYKSSGKFSLLASAQSTTENKNPYADGILNKTVTESIKTRYFVQKLYADAGVKLIESEIINIGDIIDAKVIDDSNILEVNIFCKNKNDLEKINKVFFSTLKESGVLTAGKSENQLKIVEPFYTDENPVSPKPLKYSGIAFLAALLVGILLVYTFYLPEYYKFLSE